MVVPSHPVRLFQVSDTETGGYEKGRLVESDGGFCDVLCSVSELFCRAEGFCADKTISPSASELMLGDFTVPNKSVEVEPAAYLS